MQYLTPPSVTSRLRSATPYLLGLVMAPLAGAVIKPLLRSTVKAAVGLGLQARKIAAEAREEFQDLAAEASAEMSAAEAEQSDTTAPKRGQS